MLATTFRSYLTIASALVALALGPALTAHSAVIVLGTDSAVTGNDFNASTPSTGFLGDFSESNGVYSYTYAAGANSDMLVLTFSVEKSGDPVTIAYDGVAMTEAVSSSGGSGASVWYLPNPSASGDIVIDASAVNVLNGFGIGIASLSGNGMPVELHTTGVSNGSTDVEITTTIADSFVMVGADANSTTGNPSIDAPLTQIFAVSDVGSSQPGAGYLNGVAAGTHTYSWSPNGSERGMVAASFVAIPEPGTLVLLASGCLGIVGVRRWK